MKTYRYSDPGGEYTLTEDQILEEYWDYWCGRMRHAHREDMISKERCIEDWVTVNWAIEVK